MSKYHIETIKCPKCGKGIERKVWDILVIDEYPNFKKELVKYEFFNVVCDNCGEEFDAEWYPFFYCNKKKSYIIRFGNSNIPLQYQFKPNIDFSQITNISDYSTLRIVRGYRELVDKICVLDDGYNDCYIETLKLFLIFQLYGSPNAVGNMYYLETENDALTLDITLHGGADLKHIPVGEYKKLLNLYSFKINKGKFIEVSRLNIAEFIEILNKEESKKPFNIKVF